MNCKMTFNQISQIEFCAYSEIGCLWFLHMCAHPVNTSFGFIWQVMAAYFDTTFSPAHPENASSVHI